MSFTYRWRLGLIALVCLVFAGWFAFDWLFEYPRLVERWQEYERVYDPDRKVNDRDHVGRKDREAWEAYARSRGWPTDRTPDRKTAGDVQTQMVSLLIVAPPGLLFLGAYLTSFRKWVGLTEESLVTHAGGRVPLAAITRLDLGRWKRKGIAVVHYEQQGRRGRLVLDDWKYETEPTRQMVDAVRSRMKPEQIEGEAARAAAAPDKPSA